MAISVSGVGFVRSLSRKRILVRSASATEDHHCSDFEGSAGPLKRQCSIDVDAYESPEMNTSKSVLESLPQEILIKIICGVDHDDLEQLYQVSKPVYEAAKIARDTHFAYSTPTKIRVFRNWISNSPGKDNHSSGSEEEESAPNAPVRPRRFKASKHVDRKLKKKMPEDTLCDISIALFAFNSSDVDSSSQPMEEDDNPPKRKLF